MDTLPALDIAPLAMISSRSTPSALREILCRLFENLDTSHWLVGGTAIAGYYAEHRRSDDLDIFVQDTNAHALAIHELRALTAHGLTLTHERRTPTYYHADAAFQEHRFTVDLVLDAHLHTIGHAHRTNDGVFVATATTLFATKATTLISRCSEKDLYDLQWFFNRLGGMDVKALVEYGTMIDGGLTSETLLIGIHGATLREEACQFALPSGPTPKQIFKYIQQLQKTLIEALLRHEQDSPSSTIVDALQKNMQSLRKSKK
jgi:hypothetical protein